MSLELDIPSLLAPFGDGPRSGTDLREDDDPNNAYRRIRDARNEAREEERQAELNKESFAGAMHLWRDVWDNGQHYLQTCAKDVEIVAYMIEASIRLGGFGGFATALKLTSELLNSCWGELLPTPDEDGVATTLQPLSRLNGDVISFPLMRVPVTDDTSIGQMVVWQYAQARQLESFSPDEREARVSAGGVTLELFNRAVAETKDPFYFALEADLKNARQALTELMATLEARLEDAELPNLSRFSKALEEAESVLQQIAGPRLAARAAASAEGGGGEVAAGAPGAMVGGKSAGPLSSRADALNLLELVAKWFETHEPQSLLPSEIRKAVRRGRMSPEELFVDLIGDSDARRQLYKDVGMKLPEND